MNSNFARVVGREIGEVGNVVAISLVGVVVVVVVIIVVVAVLVVVLVAAKAGVLAAVPAEEEGPAKMEAALTAAEERRADEGAEPLGGVGVHKHGRGGRGGRGRGRRKRVSRGGEGVEALFGEKKTNFRLDSS